MTPEEEGRKLFVEGVCLSNLWGDVSHENFGDFERVLNAFDAAYSNADLRAKRAEAIRKIDDREVIYRSVDQ